MPFAWKRLEEEPAETIENTARPAPEIERSETFVPETPIRSLNDLIVSKAVRNQLEAALNRIQYHDKLYNDWELKKIDPQGRRVAINFFGHPGTGKTFCAEAIAQHLGKQIITVNYAEIESKYVGETPKNITAAFTNVTQSADHGVNVSRSVMLLQLDKFEGVVIFASNLPENYDGAFVRRILAHIEFELPDLDCRLRLWQYLLPSKVPCAEDVTIAWLAAQSDRLAGGDILNVVKLAASQAVARSGNQCCVFQSDLLSAIAQVREGKAKVGSFAKAPPTIQETTVQPEELAPELRQRYDQMAAQIDEPASRPL
jgi:SpoVK/Ycf46/Vps4 family AAA+-type ATPase